MADYEWPADLPPFAMEYYLQFHSGGSESPFNRQSKIYGLSAPRWVCRISIRGGYDGEQGIPAYGPRVDAFLAKLRGRENRVSIPDFRRMSLRGEGATPTNAAAVIGATSMGITGDALTILALKGDYVGGDGRAHILREDVVTDHLGEATAYFDPPLARAIGAGAAVFGAPRSWFRLVSDDAPANGVEVGTAVTYSLDFVEDLIWLSSNSGSASAFGATLGLENYIVIEWGSSNTAKAVTRRDSVIGDLDTSIEDFFGVAPDYDLITWGERTVDAAAADGYIVDSTMFTMTRPLAIYHSYYRLPDVDNSAWKVADAATTHALAVGTSLPGTVDAKMLATATTTTTTMNNAAFGLNSNGDGEETFFEQRQLFKADRMALTTNGEEVQNWNEEVTNLSTTDPITLFAPANIYLATGSQMFLRRTIIAQVGSDFDDSDLRRFGEHVPHRYVRDILTLAHYGENAADDSRMNRQPVVRVLRETADDVIALVSWFASSNHLGNYAEDPAEIRVQALRGSKDSGLVALGASTVLDQPTGWPTAGGALPPPVFLMPTFGADAGKLFAVYDWPAGEDLVVKTGTITTGIAWSARSTILSPPATFSVVTVGGNGSSYEVPANHPTHAGRILFPVYGDFGMAMAWRDPGGTWGMSPPATGHSAGTFPNETNIAGLLNGDVVLFSRLAASWGGANIQNKRSVYTASVSGSAPVFQTLLDSTDGYEGAAAAGALVALENSSGPTGHLAFFSTLTNVVTPVRHGGPHRSILNQNFEILASRNLMSKWAIRGVMDFVQLPQWGAGWFLGAIERSLDSGNGNSSVYAILLRDDAVDAIVNE